MKATHKGNPQNFNNTVMSIQQYITDKELIPISSLYTVNVQEVKTVDKINLFHADIYIS